jgi:hypothetical protein
MIHAAGIAPPRLAANTVTDLGARGFIMSGRALLVLRCLKLVAFLAVWDGLYGDCGLSGRGP